jgi:hypothetical protein
VSLKSIVRLILHCHSDYKEPEPVTPLPIASSSLHKPSPLGEVVYGSTNNTAIKAPISSKKEDEMVVTRSRPLKFQAFTVIEVVACQHIDLPRLSVFEDGLRNDVNKYFF